VNAVTVEKDVDGIKAVAASGLCASQAPFKKPVDSWGLTVKQNVFCGRFHVQPNRPGEPGFHLAYGPNFRTRHYFASIDDLMTFLANQALSAPFEEGAA